MIFKFKQFEINQDKTAMKVGTDGVLLGAWCAIDWNPYNVLDIGTGTGLIALQIAQRSNAELIDAIEIDTNAYEQAVSNFENSSWNDRLFCYHASLNEFVAEIEDKYDLIIANPPFYTENYFTDNEARNKARFSEALSFEELLKATTLLLTDNGRFSVIIPFKEKRNFIALAEKQHLFPMRICNVKGTEKVPFKRSLLEFSFKKIKCTITELVIEIERHQYTKDYIKLVKDFYLKM
ncbi:MAG: methyltransferase [Flavobacteriaceae bacterium]